MRSALGAGVAFAALTCGAVVAQDIRALYTQQQLAKAGSVYAPNLRGLWEEDFLSKLTPGERQRAGEVSLALPLVGANRTPIDFYASAAQRTVFLPISSVKFLDDISISIGYYERKGCGMGAVSDYVGVLRERPGEALGAPRDALGVPADALKDEVVDDISQKLLKSSVYFVTAHEYAHVMYQHKGYQLITAPEAQRQETEADAFALEVMRRIAVPPLSMAHFFALVSRLERSPADFDDVQQYEAYLRGRATHPVSSQRIAAVANTLRANAKSYARLQANPSIWEGRLLLAAKELDAIARTLDDRKMRSYLTYRARTIDPASLKAACRI